MRGAQELAYLAGLFDGEGSIYTSRVKSLARVSAAITMCSPALPKVFQKRWPAYLYEGDVSKTAIGKRKQWRWMTGKVSVTRRFLEDLLPYLIVKKELATLALRMLAAQETGRRFKTKNPKTKAMRSCLRYLREVALAGMRQAQERQYG